MKGMRRVKKAINARGRLKRRERISSKARLAFERQRGRRYIPKALIEHIGRLQIPLKEKVVLYRRLAKIFGEAKQLSEDSRKHLLNKAIEMLDADAFPKFLHNINAELTAARLQMLADILKPRKRFSFKYKPEHRFPDGFTEKDVYVMRASGVGEIAVFAIHFHPALNRNYVWFVQGVKGVDMRKMPRVIGKPWYRAIMDEVIRSAKELYKAGGELKVRYSTESQVYERIKKEYLKEEDAPRMFLRLDPKKPRVEKLFEEMGIIKNSKGNNLLKSC